MNGYIVLGLITALLIAACICVYKAYRKGLRDGLDVGRTNRMKDPVVVQKKDKQAVEEVESKNLLEQLDKLSKY